MHAVPSPSPRPRVQSSRPADAAALMRATSAVPMRSAGYFAAITADLGRVDILVSNAGRSQAGKLEDLTDEIWQADFDLKVFAAIRLARLAFPGMKSRRRGRIINLEYRGEGPGARERPDDGDAFGRHGADQDSGRRRRTP